MSTSIVPLRKSAVLSPTNAGGQIVSKGALPSVVQSALANLLVAFATGPLQSEDDQVRLLRVYAGVFDGAEVGIVCYVLERLLYHNPRNPYRPTPQDIFAMIQEMTGTVTFIAAKFRLLRVYGLTDLSHERAGADSYHWKSQWGPEPGEPDCIISESAIMAAVRERIREYESVIIGLSEDRFLAIPHEAFSGGYRDRIIEKRKQHAYVESLSLEERKARDRVITQARWEGTTLDEDEIRRLTAEQPRNDLSIQAFS